MGPLSPRSLERATADGPATSVGFDAGCYAEASADTPDMLEIALDKPEYKPGDTMTVAVTARTAGKVTLNVVGDRLLSSITQDVSSPAPPASRSRSAATGAPAPMWWRRLRRPLDAQAQRMPGRAIGVQWFSVDRKARTLAVDMTLPQLHAAEHALRVPVKIDGLGAARRRASSSPRSMSASSTSPTTSRRRRTTIISASAGSRPSCATSTAS